MRSVPRLFYPVEDYRGYPSGFERGNERSSPPRPAAQTLGRCTNPLV